MRHRFEPSTDPAQATHGILSPADGQRHFTLARRLSHPELAARVERHWTVRWDLRGCAPFTQEILPHPCVNLAFQDGQGGVFGMVAGRDSRHLTGRGGALGTKFRPGAFAAFSRLPTAAVVGSVSPLAAAFGRDGERLEREVVGLGEDEHYAAVERFLLARLPDDDPVFALVSAVVDDLLHGATELRIDALAAAHGVSTRSLQRAFRTAVGVGPKWVMQRYRLHVAAERLGTGAEDDLTALALELGYFDLAHFTRQFTAAVGEPPGVYARRCAVARRAVPEVGSAV